mgnify:CR=1 FL=1
MIDKTNKTAETKNPKKNEEETIVFIFRSCFIDDSAINLLTALDNPRFPIVEINRTIANKSESLPKSIGDKKAAEIKKISKYAPCLNPICNALHKKSLKIKLFFIA